MLILVVIGFYTMIQKDNEEDNDSPSIHESGVFSLIRKSPREDLLELRPSKEKIISFLSNHEREFSPEDIESMSEKWEQAILDNIRVVEEGDKNGVQTYRFQLAEKDKTLCPFINEGSYITREQIYNFPELIPPYYIGCDCTLHSKEAWDDHEQTNWTPLLPEGGQYDIPHWKNISI